MKKNTENLTIDVMKFVMAIGVVGIHTGPFGFNIWLDRGFAIFTKLCVPFFFVTSAYFFFSKNKPLLKYLLRIIQLYVVWSIIYLPLDIASLKSKSISEIVKLFLWYGNAHGLWYLWGTVVATLIVYLLQKKFSDIQTIIIIFFIFMFGYMGSTCASTVVGGYCSRIIASLECQNGLFYGAIYVALGMYIARHDSTGKPDEKKKKYLIGFLVSLFLVIVEGVLCVLVLKTDSTILMISILPATYTLVRLCLSVEIRINREKALMLRKLSTIVYVSQAFFIKFLSIYLKNIPLFVAATMLSVLFGIVLIGMSERWSFFKIMF